MQDQAQRLDPPAARLVHALIDRDQGSLLIELLDFRAVLLLPRQDASAGQQRALRAIKFGKQMHKSGCANSPMPLLANLDQSAGQAS